MLTILKKIAKTGIISEKNPVQAYSQQSTETQLHQSILKVFGRSMAIRHIDVGSCNACELEIHALNNPYYNLEGLGIHFVASPRHADLLLVTGPVSRHMIVALERTYNAIPHPKLTVALGDCSCTGGIFGETYATCASVSSIIPVNGSIPGCPPTPTAILQGILSVVQNKQ